jgi:hypothetical protein
MLAKEILYLSGKNKHPVYRSSISGHPYMRYIFCGKIQQEAEMRLSLTCF